MALPAGAKLGPYEILSPLGAGGMGEVYRARDTRLDRTVAIKVLNSQLVGNVELRGRFEREARSISSLNHSRICILHDVGHQDGVDFLVMEYLDGETLVERLRNGPLPLKEALRIGIEVCEALEAAQRVGIVHRDLKPGNIMLTKSGAKLMDFGLAKAAATTSSSQSASAPLLSAAKTMSEATPLSPLTTAGTVIGTIQYMAPEQIEGKEADARSDLFALGAVLYEMATGKRPFEGSSPGEICSAILRDEPSPPSQVNPQIVPGLEAIIRKALEKDCSLRYQHASEMRADLQRLKRDTDSGGYQKPDAYTSATTPSASKAAVAKPRELTIRMPATRVWLSIARLVALLVAALIARGIYSRMGGRLTLTEADTVLLADFTNNTGDPLFDSTLKIALNVALTESPLGRRLGQAVSAGYPDAVTLASCYSRTSGAEWKESSPGPSRPADGRVAYGVRNDFVRKQSFVSISDLH